jgi:type I restriction enzyme R subunit
MQGYFLALPFTESVLEEIALTWLESLSWTVAYGPDIAPDGDRPARIDYGQIILEDRLRHGSA